MAIQVRCPNCGQMGRIPGTAGSRRVSCPSCGEEWSANVVTVQPGSTPRERWLAVAWRCVTFVLYLLLLCILVAVTGFLIARYVHNST